MINTVRHNEVFNSGLYHAKKIVIVGAGAIGSRVFENLASTGLENITLIDYDVVESHNLSNQLFILDDIGRGKVDACKMWAASKCGTDSSEKMTFINGKVDKDTLGWFNDAHLVISCVDSFSARRLVQLMAQNAWADMFIDTRMATQHCMQYMVNPDNMGEVRAWEATLGDDDDPNYEVSACGSTLTVGATAQMIGVVTAWSVMNYLKTGYVEHKLRVDTTPFMVSRVSDG